MIRPAHAASLVLIIPFLTFASALAPAHVHKPGPGRDREHTIAHSHLALHHIDKYDGNADASEIEQGDEDVVWLDSPILHESPYHVHPVVAAAPGHDETVHSMESWSVTPFDEGAPVHGPPKCIPLLRAPPALLV